MKRYAFAIVGFVVVMIALGRGLAQTPPATVESIAKVRAIGREGKGHDEAMAAWKSLASQGQSALPALLSGLDNASPLAANWLRSAFETIVDRDVKAGKPIDLKPLQAFLADVKHSGAARRLAFETIVRFQPDAKKSLTPTFLDDPGAELRQDAVDLVLKDAQKALDAKDTDTAKALFQKALHHARDKDQVILAAGRLEKLGVSTDLTRHFGFITGWTLIGPFDNVKGVGFQTIYPPEKGVDLKSEMIGKDNQKVARKSIVTDQPLGMVDLNKEIGALKGTAYFGHAVIESPTERPVEIRCGSNNAVRLYLNGAEVYAREEYHHGMKMDQHVGRGILKAGKNEILIKCLQNEQTEPWAQKWSFQVRVCDDLGGAAPFRQP